MSGNRSLSTYTVEERFNALLGEKLGDCQRQETERIVAFAKMAFVAGFGEAFDMVSFAGQSGASNEECMVFFERIKNEIISLNIAMLKLHS